VLLGAVVTFQDTTTAHELGRTLARQAQHDALTALPNRLLLQDRLQQALQFARRTGGCLAVMFLDRDHFKQINDRQGHDAGDAVLVVVGERLRRAVRESDLTARTGGDEFVVLVSDLPDDVAARRIGAALMQALVAPMRLRTGPCEVGATIGYALSPIDGWDVAELMRRADQAMYLGKQSGKGQVRRLEHCG
jgi:diguanylate cyclase (GGDEF)-like protein